MKPTTKKTPRREPKDFHSFKEYCEHFYPVDKFPRKRCPHPNCPENDKPYSFERCVLNDPIWISIPAGEHIHLTCPVHPQGHILYGPNIRFEITMDKGATPRWWEENNLPGKVWM